MAASAALSLDSAFLFLSCTSDRTDTMATRPKLFVRAHYHVITELTQRKVTHSKGQGQKRRQGRRLKNHECRVFSSKQIATGHTIRIQKAVPPCFFCYNSRLRMLQHVMEFRALPLYLFLRRRDIYKALLDHCLFSRLLFFRSFLIYVPRCLLM